MILLSINPKKIFDILLSIFIVLFIMNWVSVLLYHHLGYTKGVFFYLDSIFNFGKERNVPTYFNALLFIFSAQSFLLIKLLNDQNAIPSHIRKYWLFISLLFLFLGADELMEVHEMFIYFTTVVLKQELTGYLTFAWIIPYSLIAFTFFLFSIRFLLFLPKKFSIAYILCGFTYILGAVGVEMIEAKIYDASAGERTAEFFVYATIEESLEMLSLIVFFYYNLLYINASIESKSQQ